MGICEVATVRAAAKMMPSGVTSPRQGSLVPALPGESRRQLADVGLTSLETELQKVMVPGAPSQSDRLVHGPPGRCGPLGSYTTRTQASESFQISGTQLLPAPARLLSSSRQAFRTLASSVTPASR